MAYYPETERDGPELIYILKPSHWGKGLATEFAIAAIAFAFKIPNVECVLATARPENKPSIRVLEKSGMRFRAYIPENNRYLYHIERDTKPHLPS